VALTETLATKQVVAVIVGVLVVGGGGAAAYAATGGELPFASEDASAVDTVPAGVDYVVYLDPGVRDDRTTKDLVDGFVDIARDQDADYEGPASYDALRENVSEQTDADVDIDELNHAVLYGRYPDVSGPAADTGPDVDYVGVLVDSTWNESRFVDLVANGTAYEQRAYEGYTVYVQQSGTDDGSAPAPTWIGVLGDGRYVLGTEQAVTDALDVRADEADAFGGPLREQYDATREGYLRFAVNVPEPNDVTPATQAVLTDNQFGAFRNLSTVAGSYYTDGDAVGMELRLGTASEDDATDLRAILRGTFALTEESMRTREMEQLIDSATIEREATTVVVTFQRPVAEILTAVEAGVESWSELSALSSGLSAGGTFGDAVDSYNETARSADG
jgi:hypothetical protein